MRFAFACSLFLFACGHGGTTADQACTDTANARCGQFAACTVNGIGVMRAFADMATCVSRLKLSCMNALMAPSTGNTPANQELCAMAIQSESCADFLDSVTPAACIESGTIANGGGCYANAQCASGVCLVAKGSACGNCQPQPQAGASCSSTGCGLNLQCALAAMTCELYGQSGASCNHDNPCASGFSCVGAKPNANPPVDGNCQVAGSSVGAPCDNRQQTMPGCDFSKGLTCNTGQNCIVMTLGQNGASCGRQADGSNVECAAGGSCYPLGAATGGHCMTAVADGATCDTVNGPPCITPARCVITTGTQGVCTIVDPTSCK
jgi:hypothetical protein